MGRARKPVSAQKKHLTLDEKIRREQEESIAQIDCDRLEQPPAYLKNNFARNEWILIVAELKGNSMICNLDYGFLASYCNAFAEYVDATKHCQRERKIVDGRINPWIDLQKRYFDLMYKSASKCGIDINARLKNASIKLSQQDADIANEFGDI